MMVKVWQPQATVSCQSADQNGNVMQLQKLFSNVAVVKLNTQDGSFGHQMFKTAENTIAQIKQGKKHSTINFKVHKGFHIVITK